MRISDWSSDLCSSDLGVSNHSLSLGLLDPSSLFALDSGVAVVGSSYDESVDEVNTMRRAVGRTLKFLTGRMQNGVADTTNATRPEESRVGKTVVSTCSYRWSPSH